MYFCNNDGNMLYMKINDDEELKYYCKLCLSDYSLKDITDTEGTKKNTKCVYKQNYSNESYSHKTYINDNIYEDPTLPRTSLIKCINDECVSNTQNIDSDIIYIKYSAEDMKFLYCCSHCKKKWTSS